MKCLLLLDDLWENIALEEIGIPNPSRESRCTVIITTRSKRLCDKMGIDEIIKVEVLSEDEAWNLFCKKVGNVVESEHIREIAERVVGKCQGLPLAINVIGGSLRNKCDISEWKNAWIELSSNQYEIIDDMEDSVFRILKFSYDHLRSKNIKNCFLYCALYPENYEIPVTDLIERWWAEGFIDVASSFNDAYIRGHTIINHLKDVSLLEGVDQLFEGGGMAKVKMHDVTRDLALRITLPSSSSSISLSAEDGNQFLVRANTGREELSNEEDWGQFQRISLMNSKCCSLPENPTSSLLVTLFLQGNLRLKIIPESFFEHMRNLRVLDLSGTEVRELPSSVSNLVSLRGLFLVDCRHLVTLPSKIANLKKLQVLHVGGERGHFEYLPIEIQQLTLLRSLEVEFAKRPSGNRLMVPNGIISKLSLLENLCIRLYSRFGSPKFGESINEEVGSLKKLSKLEMCFTTLESFEDFLSESWLWKNESLKSSFRFTVAYNDYQGPIVSSVDQTTMQYLRVTGGTYTPGTAFLGALHRATAFHLGGNQTCQGLLDFGSDNLNQLRRCFVSDCNTMEIFINGNDLLNTTSSTTTCVAVLPNLERLDMNDMANMMAIWEGPMPPGSFSGLARLTIFKCKSLRKIFTRGILPQISNLETLCVSWCDTLQVIVNEEEEEGRHDDVALFPKLKAIFLDDLPRFERIWKTVSFPMAPSLVGARVENCPNLKSLLPLMSLGVQQKNGSSTDSTLIPFSTCNWQFIGKIEWWEALEWEHYDEIKQHLQPYFFGK